MLLSNSMRTVRFDMLKEKIVNTDTGWVLWYDDPTAGAIKFHGLLQSNTCLTPTSKGVI